MKYDFFVVISWPEKGNRHLYTFLHFGIKIFVLLKLFAHLRPKKNDCSKFDFSQSWCGAYWLYQESKAQGRDKPIRVPSNYASSLCNNYKLLSQGVLSIFEIPLITSTFLEKFDSCLGKESKCGKICHQREVSRLPFSFLDQKHCFKPFLVYF